jgi:hypothetical protein
MKGIPAVPGGRLTSKPTWSNGSGCSTTSAFFCLCQHGVVAGARRGRRSIVINGLGALANALVLAVFLLTKFIHGAWIEVVVVPFLILIFRAIHYYYGNISAQRHLGDVPPLVPRHNRVIIPVVRAHRGMIHVLE